MFYLHTSGAMCKLVDFTTKEEQKVSIQEVMDRVTNGETIVGVVKDDSVDFWGFRFTSKGRLGQISLADYAVLTDNQYLLDEFDCEKNKTTTDKISYASGKKYWWVCPEGHTYNITANKRTNRGDDCPYCSSQRILVGFNDLETFCKENNREDLLDEWDYDLNEIKPSEVTPHSEKKVYWLCQNRKHSYLMSVTSRVDKNSGCPYCSNQRTLAGFNDLETWCKENGRQELLNEWNEDLNKIKPSEVTPHSEKKVYWICPEKKHSYLMPVAKRVDRNQGCPYCHSQTSFPEQSILYYLRQVGLTVENRFKYHNKYEIDIYLSDFNIGIEYDGERWHKDINKVSLDEQKNKALSDAGIHLIRLREEGCPTIERYDTEEIIVSDLDVAIRELFSLISNKYGVSIDVDINTNRDRQTILAEYRSSKKEQSIKFTHPHIASEWNKAKNGDLKPEMFTFGSDEKVWWLCNYCGHEWKTTIDSRCITNSGCPICAKLIKHYDDGSRTFRDEYPEIEPFWSEENLNISEVPFGTHTKMKICCPICNFIEDVSRLDQRIKRQNGLTCKNCGFHVEVQKFNRERDEYIEKQKNTIDLAADFNAYLKRQMDLENKETTNGVSDRKEDSVI